MSIISIQPGQPGEGMHYNVHKPLPYPFLIDTDTGNVGRQDFWKGEPAALVGFQRELTEQRIDITVSSFAQNPDTVVGMFPVFTNDAGNFYTLTTPVTSTFTFAPDTGDEDDEQGCEGHESLNSAHMGESVYCDGSCQKAGTR